MGFNNIQKVNTQSGQSISVVYIKFSSVGLQGVARCHLVYGLVLGEVFAEHFKLL